MVDINPGDMFSYQVLFFLLVGTLAGLVVGAMPGVGPVTAQALLLPLTFRLGPLESMVLMVSVWASGIYAGSWSAILVNVPGTSMSLVTGLDGHPLARQGRALEALGAAALSSFISGVVGVVVLVTLAPLLAGLLVYIGPSQFVWIYVVTFVVVAVNFRGLRGLLALLFGLALATVGLDVAVGIPRYTLGLLYLQDGINLVPALVGLFGFSEAIALAVRSLLSADGGDTVRRLTGSMLAGFRAVLQHYRALVIGIVVGGLVGPIPGMGASASNILAWSEAKKRSRHPETFGTGNIEGVVAAEAGNNVVEGTSLISTVTLGIPGSASAAVMLTALIVQGFDPGRTLAQDPGFMISFGSLLLAAQVAMFVVGLALIRAAAYLSLVPLRFLAPAVMAFSFVGVFSMRNDIGDVIVAAVLGCVGYAMRQFGFAPVATVVGLIIGGLMERSVIQSLAISGGSLGIFFRGWINIALLLVSLLFIGRYLRETFSRPGSPVTEFDRE